MLGTGQEGRGALTAAAATLLAAAAILVACAPAAAKQPAPEDLFSFGNPAFCAPTEPVEDFGLSTLPPIDEAPALGDLPFGPKTVSLELSSGPILPPGESVGFWLHSENYGGRTPLRWVLRNRLRAVDTAGLAGPAIASGSTRVRMINAAKEVKLFLSPPRKPGFYRYDIEIVDFDGAHLASYGRYLRVERKFWDARLGLSGHEFRPGARVLSRVENFGTETISFGEDFRVQAYRKGGWVHVRNPREIWLAWLGFARPGLSGRCSAFQLPRDFPPGRYRIVKEVGSASWPTDGRSYRLTAPFEVSN